MDSKELETVLLQIQERLGVRFANQGLLLRAITHHTSVASSVTREKMSSSNEGLEFLGDRVLGCVVASMVVIDLRSAKPGRLHDIFGRLVSEPILASIARDLNLGDYLLRDARVMKTVSSRMLAETFEALVGAMFLDQGYELVNSFLRSLYDPRLEEFTARGAEGVSAKQRLEDYARKSLNAIPRYEVVRTFGPSNNPVFVMGVYVRNHLLAEGEGHNKKAASNAAAREALAKLRIR
ncbi:MAG: ribonuclease III family protein [Candidatus Kerfeldbacteria bacterium]|nr:ribonuclease III family protein [Candidatus Kerfeldbacteria bacterium]